MHMSPLAGLPAQPPTIATTHTQQTIVVINQANTPQTLSSIVCQALAEFKLNCARERVTKKDVSVGILVVSLLPIFIGSLFWGIGMNSPTLSEKALPGQIVVEVSLGIDIFPLVYLIKSCRNR